MTSLLGIVLVLVLLITLLVGIWWSLRHPFVGLGLIVGGMGFHSFILMVLLRLGTPTVMVRIAQGWKEMLIAALSVLAMVLVWRRKRDARLEALVLSDWLAIGFAVLIVIYFLLPSSVLHSNANFAQRLVGFRIAALIPLLYFLGRLLGATDESERLNVAWLCLGAGAAVTVFGIFELYLVPTRTWLDWGVSLYTGFLGFTYHGPQGLPENFFLTLPNGTLVRRMVSTYISPLPIAYTGLLLFPLGAILVDRYPVGRKGEQLAVAALILLMIGVFLSLTRLALFVAVGEACLLFILLRRLWIATLVPILIVATAFMIYVYPAFGPSEDRNLSGFREAQSSTSNLPAVALRTSESLTIAALGRTSAASIGPSPSPTPQVDTSVTEHYSALIADLKFVLQHPFGVGLGGSTARYGNLVGTGESALLGMFGDLGVLGGTLYLVFYLLALRNGFIALRVEPKPDLKSMIPIVALVGGVALIPITLTSDVWGDLSVSFLFWWAAGASATLAAPPVPIRPRREDATYRSTSGVFNAAGVDWPR